MNNEFWSMGITRKSFLTLFVILSLFLLSKTIGEIMSYRSIGGTSTPGTITVTGSGDVFAVPDVATINFSIDETGKTMEEANNKASDKNNAVLKYLKDKGIDEKDIKTESYNANPQYDYSNQVVCIKYPCPPSTPKIVGYEVMISVSVKVHKVDQAGTLLSGISALQVSNISGPTLGIDDADTLKSEARKKAIDSAKSHAEELANQLGVRLGKISSFSESQGGYPVPMYAAMESKAGVGGGPVSPDIATGQNKVTVTVSLTYEIR